MLTPAVIFLKTFSMDSSSFYKKTFSYFRFTYIVEITIIQKGEDQDE